MASVEAPRIFIAVEGIGGSGKTTVVAALAKYFRDRGRVVMTTSSPGTGLDFVRPSLLERNHPSINYLTKTLLFLADRSELIEKEIVPALDAGMVAICERFTDSTVAYQGGGDGISRELLYLFNDLFTGTQYGELPFPITRPSLTILLDVDPAIGLARMQTNSRHSYDRHDLEYQERVRQWYLAMARFSDTAGGTPRENFYVWPDHLIIDTNGETREVIKVLLDEMDNRFTSILG